MIYHKKRNTIYSDLSTVEKKTYCVNTTQCWGRNLELGIWSFNSWSMSHKDVQERCVATMGATFTLELPRLCIQSMFIPLPQM